MRSIKYALLVFGLVLTAACEKPPAEPAVNSSPTAVTTPETAASVKEGAMSPSPEQPATLGSEPVKAMACATGCITMNCPPPNGQPACCKKTATGYKTCI